MQICLKIQLPISNLVYQLSCTLHTIVYSDVPLPFAGKYIGNRPIKLRKSTWKDRNIDVVRKKVKEKKKLGLR